MNGPGPGVLQTRAEKFKKLVPVFTNVIFDTSQVHANTLFAHMFAWLDHVDDPRAELIQKSSSSSAPIRMKSRPGKESRESVADWVEKLRVNTCPTWSSWTQANSSVRTN